MSEYHVVAQGEHLSGIAHQYGYRSYKEIWNHPNNAELKNERKNPNVLYPGDQLFIPDKKKGEYSRSTDATHKFQVKLSPLKLRLTLEDQYEKPIAGADCLLVIDGDSKHLTTDGKGKIEVPIPPTAHEAYLVVNDASQTPYDGVNIPIKIGNLDPEKEVSGQQARLKNLGYFWGDVDGQDSDDFESAVEEFQCDHSLKVDGICGPKTQAKLKEVHGC